MERFPFLIARDNSHDDNDDDSCMPQEESESKINTSIISSWKLSDEARTFFHPLSTISIGFLYGLENSSWLYQQEENNNDNDNNEEDVLMYCFTDGKNNTCFLQCNPMHEKNDDVKNIVLTIGLLLSSKMYYTISGPLNEEAIDAMEWVIQLPSLLRVFESHDVDTVGKKLMFIPI